ncbi:MAG: NADPH-dependent oxidoreductase [Beijerinckiaceae bacterium]|nr:NADPH-dependent oxidoreductase [Beijerinckiaceae bacterium]MCZ8300191.1 NADPH-dependent oxidoreductase [Beijerinckiaceae bacterium]
MTAPTPEALSAVTVKDGLEKLVRARYRDAEGVAGLHGNETLGVLAAHRSVRSYRPDPLPEGTLETLVLAAQSAATSSNLQTWSVVAVTDPARKAVLAEIAGGQKHILQAPLMLVWLADLSRLKAMADSRGQAAEGLDYLEMATVAIVDAALAAQNAVIAAESLGLGTVYIGALRNDPGRVAALLGLPKMVFAVFGLCVGHPAEEVVTGVKPRLSPEVVLHRETYGQSADPEAIARYDVAMQDFQGEQGMRRQPWSDQALARVADARALSGRDVLAKVLGERGFRLR